jgi:hypothetical protein
MVTDSERFYSSILDLFEDIDEQEDVNALLIWWNRFVSLPTLTLSQYPQHDSVRSSRRILRQSVLFLGTVHTLKSRQGEWR